MMTQQDYKVADIKLAEYGRKEMAIAESEMPALMKLRERLYCICFLNHELGPMTLMSNKIF